jgi:hypothetical protein
MRAGEACQKQPTSDNQANRNTVGEFFLMGRSSENRQWSNRIGAEFRIHDILVPIRIRILLFSSLTFKTATKN